VIAYYSHRCHTPKGVNPMSAFNQSNATVPVVRLIDVERQPVTLPESAKVIAIASSSALRELRGIGERKPARR
jgi:hypothetical protein